MARVKSLSMYQRLCDQYPDGTETNAEFADSDKKIDEIVQADIRIIEVFVSDRPRYPFRLLNIPKLHMWLDFLGDALDKFPYAHANNCIMHGNTNLLRYLVDTGRVDLRRIIWARTDTIGVPACYLPMDISAKRGYLEILKMLHETGYHKASTEAMDWAARSGHFDVVKFLHETRHEGCTHWAIDGTAMNGHLDIIKWLNENFDEGCTTNAIRFAAKNGHLHVVKWLYGIYNEVVTTIAMDMAAGHGHLDIVKWLHENCTEGCTTEAMNHAAMHGDLDMIKWFHENRSERCTTDAMDQAVRHGKLEAVKWLHENRNERCSTNVVDGASEYGQIDVIRFLLANRSEGFSDDAIKRCRSKEIAKMLVATLSSTRRREIWQNAVSEQWSGPGVEVLRESMMNQ